MASFTQFTLFISKAFSCWIVNVFCHRESPDDKTNAVPLPVQRR